DTIYFSTTEKLFQYHKEGDTFKEGGILSSYFNGTELISGKIVNTADNKIWGFTQNSVFNIEPARLGEGYLFKTVFLPNDIKNITRGYENITEINDDSFLLGVSNGYLKFHHIPQTALNADLRIEKVFTSAIDKAPKRLNL